MAESLMRFFRKENESASTQGPLTALSAERIARHSTGFEAFSAHIAGSEGLTVLDLGPTSPRNIQYLTSLGHKLYNVDVLAGAADPTLSVPAEGGGSTLDVERFLAENVNFRGRKFDAVLCWDVADYLQEILVRPLVERIHGALNPGGVLLGFFHTRDAGPDAPYYRYHITSASELELQPARKRRLQRVFNNRHIENLFGEYRSLKFFLARDFLREVLVVR